MGDLVGVGLISGTNQTNDDDDMTLCDQVNTSAHVFFVLFYSLMFLVGLVLNGMTMKVYFCSDQQQVSSILMVYLKNLVAADLLLCLSLPIRIINYVSKSITFRLMYCTIASTAFFTNLYASILFMGYIACNRYLKIVHPHIRQTVKAARIIAMATWVFLLVILTTYIVLWLHTQETPTVLHDKCEAFHSHQVDVFSRIINKVSGVLFLVVLISLVFFYYSISRSVSLQQQKQLASNHKKLVKSRRNMLLLVSVFCVCFIPYHLVRLPYTFLWRQCSLTQVFYYLKHLTTMLSAFNICLDPLVYFFFSKAFRAQLKGNKEPANSSPTQTNEL